MYNKDILNYIFNHHELGIKNLTTETLPLYVKKYKRLLKTNFDQKCDLNSVKMDLHSIFLTLIAYSEKYRGSTVYDNYNMILSQLSHINFDNIKYSLFYNKLSITLPNEYDNDEILTNIINILVKNGFIISEDNLNNLKIKSLEIEINTNNADIYNEYELSDFNLSTIKKFKSCVSNIDSLNSNNEIFNIFDLMKSYLEKPEIIKNNQINHYNMMASIFQICSSFLFGDINNDILILDNIVDITLNYINIIQIIKDSGGSAEDLFELYLSLLILYYNKIIVIYKNNESILNNAYKHELYRSFLSNIYKITQSLNIINDINYSCDTLKTNALLKLKRIMTLIADKIKEDQ